MTLFFQFYAFNNSFQFHFYIRVVGFMTFSFLYDTISIVFLRFVSFFLLCLTVSLLPILSTNFRHSLLYFCFSFIDFSLFVSLCVYCIMQYISGSMEFSFSYCYIFRKIIIRTIIHENEYKNRRYLLPRNE